jgi:hypothetical protein
VLCCVLLPGVDFAIKRMEVGDHNIKLTIWDTAGEVGAAAAMTWQAIVACQHIHVIGLILVQASVAATGVAHTHSQA